MKTMTAVLMMIAVLIAGNAEAENMDYELKPPPQTNEKLFFRSPAAATGLSVGGFLIPVAMVISMSTGNGGGSGSPAAGMMMLAGSIFGPGLGHAYAGESGRFWKGAGIRTVSWGAFMVAFAMSWDNPDAGGASVIAVGSGVLYLVSAIRDMVTAGNSARRYNDKLASSQVTVAPTWSPNDESVGVRVAVGF